MLGDCLERSSLGILTGLEPRDSGPTMTASSRKAPLRALSMMGRPRSRVLRIVGERKSASDPAATPSGALVWILPRERLCLRKSETL